MTTPATAKSPPARPPEPDDGIDYPYGPDALPVKSMYQFVPQAYMQSALETWLDDPTTLIASQMFIYYEPGNPRVSVAPDVYIIPNVGSALRRSYFLWLEHEVPTFAMEIASSSTYRNDGGFKHRLYETGACRNTGATTRKADCLRRCCRVIGWWTDSTRPFRLRWTRSVGCTGDSASCWAWNCTAAWDGSGFWTRRPGSFCPTVRSCCRNGRSWRRNAMPNGRCASPPKPASVNWKRNWKTGKRHDCHEPRRPNPL